jgi:hypothetical protein
LFRKIRSNRQKENEFIYRMVVGSFLVLLIYQMTTNGVRQRPFWFVPALAVAAVSVFGSRTERRALNVRHIGV